MASSAVSLRASFFSSPVGTQYSETPLVATPITFTSQVIVTNLLGRIHKYGGPAQFDRNARNATFYVRKVNLLEK